MKKFSAKKIGISIIAIFFIILVFYIISKNNMTLKKVKISDPELLKSITYEQFSDNDRKIENCDFVEFSAFFLKDLDGDGYTEKLKGTCKELGGRDTLYMEINVIDDGVLKDGKIQIDGKNFYLQTSIPKDYQIKTNAISNNAKIIELNTITNGTQKLISGEVRSGDYTTPSTITEAIKENINNYSRNDNKIIFSGTYVNSAGEEIPVNKVINLEVDWYGRTNTNIKTISNNYNDLDSRIDSENKTINLSFSINTNETIKKLILKKNYIEGNIPNLNGYAPIEVSSDIDGLEYNEQEMKFTIVRESEIDSNGNVVTGLARENYYTINVKYPLEAYELLNNQEITLNIPISEYYEGYNNPNSEFDNPYKSNIALATINCIFAKNVELPITRDPNIDITVGTYLYNPYDTYIVSKQKPLKLYNGISSEEKNDIYPVKWVIYTGTESNDAKIVLKERSSNDELVSDQFIKNDDSKDSMENLVTNKSISFSNLEEVLKLEGELKVYDDVDGELLLTINSDNIKYYKNGQIFTFNYPVKHLRVELTNYSNNHSLIVCANKEIDDGYIYDNYSLDEFKDLKYIQSDLVAFLDDTLIGVDNHRALYAEPVSIANVSLNKPVISTQFTEENEIITIDARYESSMNQIGWKNGIFLVKLPNEILDAEINSVTIDNLAVEILDSMLIEDENGMFIKIYTKNNEQTNFKIKIDTNVTPDPRIMTTAGAVELYAFNNEGTSYAYESVDLYDINDNLNTSEIIHKTSIVLNMVSPSSVITNQEISNFDDKGTVIVSPKIADVKPIYANVDNESLSATVGVQVKNNYSNIISDVVILGKIPFEGNTYVISENDLKSNFSTTMSEGGIRIPEELSDLIEVYYSTNENPTKDLNVEDNGWITKDNVDNWSEIKTYLIDFKEQILEVGKDYTFYYDITIPNGLEFNQVSYSHHGVYFCLNTEEGKYRTQTEPTKIGVRIAQKFKLELTKMQKGKENIVPGSTYTITPIITDELGNETRGLSKTGVTGLNGKILFNDVYCERVYEIKEINTTDNYELNEDIIRIIGHVNKNTGELTVEKLQGDLRGDIIVEKQENEIYCTSLTVEDEVRAKLKITKIDKENESLIKGVKFKIKGKGFEDNEKILTTDRNGFIELSGLYIGNEYCLEETKAYGYYINSPIKFIVVNNEGEYTLQFIDTQNDENTNIQFNGLKNSRIYEEANLPVIEFTIENEKIPTYDLELIKIKHTNDVILDTDTSVEDNEIEITYLAGAKFKLYKEGKELGSYITDENGKIIIENLYQFVSTKDLDCTYVLKEVVVPNGYSKVKDITFRVEKNGDDLEFKEELQYGQNEKRYSVVENKVSVIVEDNPTFKLVKKDGQTGDVLENAKFAIYSIENGMDFAKNSKGEYVGKKEVIDNKEYYIVITDRNGEITIDLPEGLYKAVEVKASDEKYDLTENVYFFGIGVGKDFDNNLRSVSLNINRELKKFKYTSDGGIIAFDVINSFPKKSNIIKYSIDNDVEWVLEVPMECSDINKLEDGGYIISGITQMSSGTYDLGNGTNLIISNDSHTKGVLIKIDEDGKALWAKSYGKYLWNDTMESAIGTSDGGWFAIGKSSLINIDGVSISNTHNSDDAGGLCMKYDKDGVLEWFYVLGGKLYKYDNYMKSAIQMNDNKIIAVGYMRDANITIGDKSAVNHNQEKEGSKDGFIVQFSPDGEIEWMETIGGVNDDEIASIMKTSDGGFIIRGSTASKEFTIGGETYNLENSGSFIIKYSANREIEWSKIFELNINTMDITKDGGYIFSSYTPANGVVNISGKQFNVISNCFAVFKINSNFELEYYKTILKNVYDVKERPENENNNILIATSRGIYEYEEYTYNEIIEDKIIHYYGDRVGINNKKTKILDNNDYLIIGNFSGSEIDIDENNKIQNVNSSYYDSFILKYSSDNTLLEYNCIGGVRNDLITDIEITDDGGYIVTGYSDSKNLIVDDIEKTIASRDGYQNGFICKYNKDGNLDYCNSFDGDSNTISNIKCFKDGSYLIYGNFSSSELKINEECSLSRQNNETTEYLIKYSKDNNIEWFKYLPKITKNDLIITEDNNIVICGMMNTDITYEGKIITRKGNEGDAIIIIYDENGNKIFNNNWGEFTVRLDAKKMCSTSDGGFVCVIASNGFYSYVNGVNYVASSYKIDDYNLIVKQDAIIKFDRDNNIEWIKQVPYSVNDIKVKNDRYYVAGNLYENGPNPIRIELDEFVLFGKYFGVIELLDNTGHALNVLKIDNQQNEFSNIDIFEDNRIIALLNYRTSSITINGCEYKKNGFTDSLVIILNEIGENKDQQVLEIENNVKEFKITTEVKIIDGIKGGSISGEGLKSYEKVKYGESSVESIKMIPDLNYEISKITVNGQNYEFTKSLDGTYTMPQFENVTEDKHIVVTYMYKDNKIVINKVDSKTQQNINDERTTFRIQEKDNRELPNDAIGELVGNGAIVDYVINNKIDGVVGEIVNNGDYYFVEQDGKFVPTNSKSYTGTRGVSSSEARSYIPIDLSDKTDKYKVVFNIELSSENRYDYGFAFITENTSAPSYNSNTNRIFCQSGTLESTQYISQELQGGKVYYLHLGYRKDFSGDFGMDQVTFDSIDVYDLTAVPCNFIDNDGRYESECYGKSKVTCNSYVPIDLTNSNGRYVLSVNAQISSEENGDFGYLTILEQTDRPSYYTTKGRFAMISGEIDAKDYTIEIEGGKQYYLHLGYYKNQSGDYGEDKFIVNSIKLSLSDSSLWYQDITTNSEGQAITQIPFGQYVIKEIVSPNGYYLNENPIEIDFSSDDNSVHEFTIEDDKKQTVIVHHYFKNKDGIYTDIKVAEDEILDGREGEKYETKPNMDIIGYDLEKDDLQEYIIPNNSNGLFSDSIIEVNYYYEKCDVPLTIHHYIEGTTKQVPLSNGENAEDEIYYGVEGNSYTTSPISNAELSDKYELSQIPENAEGTYSGSEVIVVYNYKKIKRNIIVEKVAEDNTTLLPNAIFEIDGEEYTTDENGKIILNLEAGNHIIKEIQAPEGYILDEDEKTYTVNRDTVNDEKLTIVNEKKKGKVIVHHYLIGTGEQYEVAPVRPVFADGITEAQDEIKTNYIGETYATKPDERISKRYKVVLTSGETSGIYDDTNDIHVYYYYNYDDFAYSVHYYYDYVEREEYVENGEKLRYGSVVSDYIDKAEGYNFEKVIPENSNDNTKANLIIRENEEENVINVYYLSNVSIETEVISHTETYKDGTILENVTGGKIYELYNESEIKEHEKETLIYGNNSSKPIIIVPDEGYEIASIKVLAGSDEQELDVKSLVDDNGNVTLEEYENVKSNIKVQVEFRKKSKVIVKYLSENEFDESGNYLVLAQEENFEGLENTVIDTENKLVNHYINSNPSITDDNKNVVESSVVITADEQIIIYWYKKIESGFIVRHIEITEDDIRNGLDVDSGVTLDIEYKEGLVDDKETVLRNIYSNENGIIENEKYENYVSIDGPNIDNEIIFVVPKESNSKDIILVEDAVLEVRFYYIRQYNMITKIIPHEEQGEMINGGTITGENAIVYEVINRNGTNKKEIIIKADDGYRIKNISINGISIKILDEKYMILDENYFTKVVEDKNIVVEFEKILIQDEGDDIIQEVIESGGEIIEEEEITNEYDGIKSIPTGDSVIISIISIIALKLVIIILIKKKNK